MSWEAIGAIGGLIGAIAVVATLAYLAAQIKQNTRALTTAIYESVMGGFNDVIAFHNSDSITSSLTRRGWLDPDRLNEEEAFRFNMLARYFANHIYKLFRLYQAGAFPEAEWRRAAIEGMQIFSTPGGRKFRESNHYYHELWVELGKFEGEAQSDFSLTRTLGQGRHANETGETVSNS